MQTEKLPVIGIVPSFDDGTVIRARGGDAERIYIRHEYSDLLAAVGALPVILHPAMPMSSITEMCDGIVLSGGEDIDPVFYQEKPIDQLRIIEPAKRFHWETELIDACDKAEVPILGICYGLQRLNVHYGGTLIQDIPTYLPDNSGHDTTLHHITFLHEFLGMRQNAVHDVNSRHHQAIERLADGFTVAAIAPDGIIEAFIGHGHYGMQWHPESDETGAHVYRAFIEICKKD